MTGRKPKPSARRKLEGSPGHRRHNEHEPQFPDVVDAVPTELTENALAATEWTRVMPLLRAAHVVTEGDRTVVIALCLSWAVYLDAMTRVRAAGMVVRSPSGYPMPNPYVGIANKALGNCIRLWAELGLTPTARTRVSTTPFGGPFDDAFAEFDDPPPRSH